jgi:hypothetical protein
MGAAGEHGGGVVEDLPRSARAPAAVRLEVLVEGSGPGDELLGSRWMSWRSITGSRARSAAV